MFFDIIRMISFKIKVYNCKNTPVIRVVYCTSEKSILTPTFQLKKNYILQQKINSFFPAYQILFSSKLFKTKIKNNCYLSTGGKVKGKVVFCSDVISMSLGVLHI